MGHNLNGNVQMQISHDRPHLLAVSAPNQQALQEAFDAVCHNLAEKNIGLYTQTRGLLEKGVHDEHRAYAVARDPDISNEDFVVGQANNELPGKICLLFTGQGAQWPQMGKDLLTTFSVARKVIAELDNALQSFVDCPPWSIAEELTASRTRDQYSRPEIAQTLTTAVQLAIVAVYQHWGIHFEVVIGHSSGEIAAACAAGLISRTEAIIAAYTRGWSVSNCEERPAFDTGMLAAGVSSSMIQQLILEEEAADKVKIACYNGPRAVTLSGSLEELKILKQKLDSQGKQNSLLSCPVAYHHPKFMEAISRVYESKLKGVFATQNSSKGVFMVSTVTTDPVIAVANAMYWKTNMLSPIRFEETLSNTLTSSDPPTILIEVGPVGSLAGAVMDIKTELGGRAASTVYYKSMNRGKSSIMPMFQVAGGLFLEGFKIDLARVNSP